VNYDEWLNLNVQQVKSTRAVPVSVHNGHSVQLKGPSLYLTRRTRYRLRGGRKGEHEKYRDQRGDVFILAVKDFGRKHYRRQDRVDPSS